MRLQSRVILSALAAGVLLLAFLFLAIVVGRNKTVGGSRTDGKVGIEAKTAPAPEAASTTDVDALSNTCPCPQLPVVTTKRDPSVGFLRTTPIRSIAAQDPNPDDLRAIFSNRDTRYGDSWSLAVKSLAYDIDPDGRLGIASGPAPRPTEDIPIVEGMLSQSWVRPFGTVERGMRVERNQSSFRYVTRAFDVMGLLVATIARSNKYGEPSFGMRENALALAQFSTDILAIPNGPDAKGRLLSGFGEEARVELYFNLNPASAPNLKPLAATALPVDGFDLTNAALDILAWREAKKGTLHVIDAAKWEPGAVVNIQHQGLQRIAGGNGFGAGFVAMTNNRELGSELVRLASMRSAFGSGFAPGSPQDAIGCKAYNLILLLGKGGAINIGLTAELLATLPITDPAQGQPPAELHRASLSALAAVGFKDDAEAQKVAKSLFRLGYPDRILIRDGRTLDWSAMDAAVIDAMRALSAHGGPNDHAADAFYAQTVADFRDVENVRRHDGLPGPELAYLTQWNAMNAVQVANRGSGLPPPVCAGGQTHCDIEKIIDAPEPDFEVTSQVHVRPADAEEGADDAENLYWTDPLTIEVKLPIKGASGQQHPTVTVQNLSTGKSAVVSTTFDFTEPGLAVFHSRRVYFNSSKLFGPNEAEEEGGGLIKGVLKKYFGGPPNYIGIEAHNGEKVRFTFGDLEPIEIDFYDSPYQAVVANYKKSFETMSLYYSALIGAPSTKEHAADARADQEELHRKVRLLANAGRIIDSRIDAVHGYRFTDLSRLKVAQLYEKLVENQQIVYTGMQYEGQGPPKHFAGDTPLERAFGIVCVSTPEYAGLLDALRQAHEELLNKTKELGIVYTLGTYHAVVAASGAENYVILWFGVDAQGNEYDASGRVNAGLSIVKDLVVSKLQADLFEKVHAKLSGGPEGPWKVRSELSRDRELTVLEPGVVVAPTEKGFASIARAEGDPVARLAGRPVQPPPGKAGAYGWAGEVEVRAGPLDGVAMPEQQFANSCGISMVEAMLRGLLPKKILAMKGFQRLFSQRSLAKLAYRDGLLATGVYGPEHPTTLLQTSGPGAGGMWEPEVALLAERQGLLQARGFETDDVRLLSFYKKQGYEVAVIINLEGGDTHWVRIEGFAKMRSGNMGVAIGDPAYGKSVLVNAQDFCAQLFRSIKRAPGGPPKFYFHGVVAKRR